MAKEDTGAEFAGAKRKNKYGALHRIAPDVAIALTLCLFTEIFPIFLMFHPVLPTMKFPHPLPRPWLLLVGAVALTLAAFSCDQTTQHPTASGGSTGPGAPIPVVNDGLAIAAPADTLTPQPAVRQASIAQEQARFVLQPGYRIEPVLTEPAVQEPAAIAFDGNGRMFVLELRSYMQDADATGELEPTSRISLHEDTNNDGVYDRHSVFVDSLVFARFVMPFGKGSILAMESNEDEVYRFTDTDGDGVADEKERFTTNYGRAGNVEHQQAFLYWGMDNWLYSTYNAFRVRWDGTLRESTGPNGAQWGVTQDNEGKIWFQGGASGLPSYFQFPIVYGSFNVEDQLEEGFDIPYGLAGLGDFQPGPEASRPDGTLNQVTGSAGNDVYRGDRLPEDLVGDYLYGEPVARIVRRIRPVVTEGLTQLRNVYQDQASEFIRSTDPLFRPVDMATAPDGSLYIVDMYRGIIQEGQWVPPGSHLRNKVEQYQLDKAIGHGRIWRLTYEGMARDRKQPRMLDETPAQLVRHLAHPNGWWRDTAQQLLVLSRDRSVVPALETMVRTSDNLTARFHALWTLEGLGALDADLVRAQMQDANPRMRMQAIRVSETRYKAGDTSFQADYRTLAQDADPEVVIQAMMTLNTLAVPDREAAIQAAQAANPARGVQEIAERILTPPTPAIRNRFRFTEQQQALLAQGATIYSELCAQCHGETGYGTPLGAGQTLAPALAHSPRVQGHRDYVTKILVHGLTGPLEGKTYPGGLMVSMADNTDEWIASVASFIRTNLENQASLVTPEDVARVRAETAGRTTPYSYEQLSASVPVPIQPDKTTWKVSASHSAPTRVGGTASAMGAFSFEGWTTGVAQEQGMWFQVEMAAPAMLTEIQFDASFRRRGRGPDAPPPVVTFPRGYRVQVSMDGSTWSAPVAEGQGDGRTTVITFEPVQARFVRITQTAAVEDAPDWSMQELQFYGLMP